jgi:hypothetical protein
MFSQGSLLVYRIETREDRPPADAVVRVVVEVAGFNRQVQIPSGWAAHFGAKRVFLRKIGLTNAPGSTIASLLPAITEPETSPV